MKPELRPDESARARFVSGIRSFILNDLAGDMRKAYEAGVEPAFVRENGRSPESSNEVHSAMRGDMAFNIYSAMRVQAQKMVWQAVEGVVVRDIGRIETEAAKVESRPGSVTLDENFEVPRYVDAIDVHLMPGSYTRGGATLEAGAVYDQGLAVFSMGLMGENLDDIGQTMSAYVSERFPYFKPQRILDTGCSIGHNTLPWKQAYPDAEVHAIDAAEGPLLYASARAKMQEMDVDFRQMSAADLDYEDGSFDVVFSSMFLHELPKKARVAVLNEAFRVLRPGGLLLTMELPPNGQLDAFSGFFLDWDSWYNEEPFYKAYRDEMPEEFCVAAGFDRSQFFQFAVPPIGIDGRDGIRRAVADEAEFVVDSENTGRLAEGITWYGFGAWKK